MNDQYDPFSKLGNSKKQPAATLSPQLDQRLFVSKKITKEESTKKLEPVVEKKEKIKTSERPDGRLKRHPFDIFEDQLTGLAEIQLKIQKETGKKPTLGELVREALDNLIKKKSS